MYVYIYICIHWEVVRRSWRDVVVSKIMGATQLLQCVAVCCSWGAPIVVVSKTQSSSSFAIFHLIHLYSMWYAYYIYVFIRRAPVVYASTIISHTLSFTHTLSHTHTNTHTHSWSSQQFPWSMHRHAHTHTHTFTHDLWHTSPRLAQDLHTQL